MPETLRPSWLRSQFGTYWQAVTYSEIGAAVGAGAIPLIAILALNASAFQVSLISACSAAMGAVSAIMIYSHLARFSHIPTMIVCDVVRFTALASIGLTGWLGGLSVLQLCLVAGITTAATIIFSGASAPILTDIVKPDALHSANSRLEGSRWLSSTVGPPIGGMLITLVGAVASVTVDAISYIASALTLRKLHQTRSSTTDSSNVPEPLKAQNIRQGAAYIWNHPTLKPLFVNGAFFGGAVMMLAPLIAVFMLGTLGLDAIAYGIVVGVSSLGGIAGAFMSQKIAVKMGRHRALLLSGASRAAAMAPVPFLQPGPTGFIVLLACESLLMFSAGLFNPTFATIRLDAVSSEYRSRVATAWSSINRITAPMFIVAGGVLAGLAGVRASVAVACGALIISAAFLPWRQRT